MAVTKGQNKKFYVVIILLIVLVSGIFAQYAFSSLMTSLTIMSTGQINSTGYYNVTAASGSAADIQAAVSQVEKYGTYPSAGCGNVFIPAGTWNWNGGTVSIPAGVNVFGAAPAGCSDHSSNWTSYTAQTILNNTMVQASPTPPYMFQVGPFNPSPGASHLASRVAGIEFKATAPTNTVDENNYGACAIDINQIYGFRVDHCTFVNFANIAVYCDANSGWNSSASCYGVIDHCVITNPYKTSPPSDYATNGGWTWGYGVYARGADTVQTGWTLPITDYYGYYGGVAGSTIMYVEDCQFSYCRHCTDACQGGYVVDRFDLFDLRACKYWTGLTDIHGTPDSVVVGGRGMEAYNNTFLGWTDTPSSLDAATSAICLRGGSGLFFNNTYTANGNSGESASFVCLSSQDDTSGGYQNEAVNQTYIWGNTVSGLGSAPLIYIVNGNSVYSITLNTNYFLRAPDLGDDGFTYTPYTYPHPLDVPLT